MINKKTARSFCKDDISKIENYEQAINDTKRWVCHHRLEMSIDGEQVHTPESLSKLGMYKKRPYFELIFMLQVEHIKLHQNAHNSFKGKHIQNQVLNLKEIGQNLM